MIGLIPKEKVEEKKVKCVGCVYMPITKREMQELGWKCYKNKSLYSVDCKDFIQESRTCVYVVGKGVLSNGEYIIKEDVMK